MKQVVKWTGALGLSLLAHAGGAMLITPDEENVQIAGGSVTEVTLLGNAFEDMLEAGDPSEAIEPTEEVVQELTPAEIRPMEAVREVEPAPPDIVSERPSEVMPSEADVILPAEEMPAIEAADAAVAASAAPIETVVPQARPEPPESVKPKVEKPEPKQPVRKKKIARKKGGNAGEQASNQRKGQEDGLEKAAASATAGTKGGIARQTGNAAVSNYPGKVRRKLSRARRYPSAARRERLRGVAHVRFIVTADGGLAGVSLAKSAGSPILDQAALDAVRRAAPFPAIPAGAGRDRWVFTIPLEFKR